MRLLQVLSSASPPRCFEVIFTIYNFRVPQGDGWKGIALSSELGYRNTLMFQIQANSKKGFNSVIGVDDLQLTGCQGIDCLKFTMSKVNVLFLRVF